MDYQIVGSESPSRKEQRDALFLTLGKRLFERMEFLDPQEERCWAELSRRQKNFYALAAAAFFDYPIDLLLGLNLTNNDFVFRRFPSCKQPNPNDS